VVNSLSLQNATFPFVWYPPPGDKETSISDNCEQLIEAPANVSHSYVVGSEYVGVKEEDDDVLSSLISSHLHDAGRDIFTGDNSGPISNAEHIDDSNVCNQMHSNSTSGTSGIKEEDGDVLSSLISSHLHDVGHDIFTGDNSGPISNAEHMDDSNVCSNQMHSNSTSGETFTAEKSHECDVCHSRFECPSKLAQHEGIHSEKYICNICNKVFRSINALSAHKQIHNSHKRNKRKSDRNKQAFSDRHQIRNVRPRPCDKLYVCGFCDKAFKYNSYLTTHMGLHIR